MKSMRLSLLGVLVVVVFTACSGGGGGSSAVGTSSPPANVPRFSYVADYFDNSVSIYALDATTGRLKFIAKAAAGTGPYSVTVDPSGKYAYVANAGSANVSQYTIGANGALSAMTPATIAAVTGPSSVTVDPSGKYAYVANAGSANVSQYTIGANGALSAMTPATIAAGTNPYSVTTVGAYQ